MLPLLPQHLVALVALLWASLAHAATSDLYHLQRRARISIHIFIMQKDEGALLLDWFHHHVSITGNPANIHLIDHDSNDPGTLRVLAYIRSQGGEVIHHSLRPLRCELFT